MADRFQDRIMMVTGASSGLGRALCVAVAAQGADVVALARSEEGLAAVQKDIEDSGGRCLCIPFDLLRFEDYGKLFLALKDQVPHLDDLVHCAGSLDRCAPMQYVKAAEFRVMLDIHLAAPNLLTQALFPLLKRAPHAAVIFTTCDMADAARPNWHGYGMAKAGLAHAAAMWQLEHPDASVGFTAINPGRMRTKLMKRAYPGIDEATVPGPESAAGVFLHVLANRQAYRGRHISTADIAA